MSNNDLQFAVGGRTYILRPSGDVDETLKRNMEELAKIFQNGGDVKDVKGAAVFGSPAHNVEQKIPMVYGSGYLMIKHDRQDLFLIRAA